METMVAVDNCSLTTPEGCEEADFLRLLFDRYVVPETLEWAVLPIFFALFFVGLGGNGLVAFVVLRNPEMRTVTNVFLLNLALADFLVCSPQAESEMGGDSVFLQVLLLCMPVTILWDITYTWWLGTPLCRLILYINVSSLVRWKYEGYGRFPFRRLPFPHRSSH